MPRDETWSLILIFKTSPVWPARCRGTLESVVPRLFAYISPESHHTETLLGDQHLEIPSVRWPRGVNQNNYSLKYLLTSLRRLV